MLLPEEGIHSVYPQCVRKNWIYKLGIPLSVTSSHSIYCTDELDMAAKINKMPEKTLVVILHVDRKTDSNMRFSTTKFASKVGAGIS